MIQEYTQICTGDDDCGTAVCLGIYIHPTELSYPFDPQFNNTCGKDLNFLCCSSRYRTTIMLLLIMQSKILYQEMLFSKSLRYNHSQHNNIHRVMLNEKNSGCTPRKRESAT